MKQPTQLEYDLGRNLKNRLYQALDDYRDTASIAGIAPDRIVTMMVANLFDIGITGMEVIGGKPDSIEAVFHARVLMHFEKEKRRKQSRKKDFT